MDSAPQASNSLPATFTSFDLSAGSSGSAPPIGLPPQIAAPKPNAMSSKMATGNLPCE